MELEDVRSAASTRSPSPAALRKTGSDSALPVAPALGNPWKKKIRKSSSNIKHEILHEPKPFTQTVIHSIFRPAKLTRPLEEALRKEESVLEPAMYDPLMNPAPHPEGEEDDRAPIIEEANGPGTRRKNKIRWSKYIPYVWVVVMAFILAGFLPWGIYSLHASSAATYVQVHDQPNSRFKNVVSLNPCL